MPKDQKTSKVKRGLHVILVSSLAGANLATILLMLACCLSTYLSPELHPRLSQAGLLFPVFLGIDLLFIAAWLLVSWKWVLLPLLGIACCGNYAWEYFPLNIRTETVNEGFSLLSYNVAHFATDSVNNMDGKATAEYIRRSNADIICLQECQQSGKIFPDLAAQLDSAGYSFKAHKGLVIFSRFPFIGEAVYTSPASLANGTMAWMMDIEGDTVLVINNHLQSNLISPKEKDIYNRALHTHSQEDLKESGKLLLSRLTRAASGRAEQTDLLCNLIETHSSYSIVSAGDMNDTPISYTYQSVARLLKSAYAESGRGLGISFNGKGFPVRIDHAFVSADLKTTGTYIDSKALSSDHRPLRTHISKAAF